MELIVGLIIVLFLFLWFHFKNVYGYWSRRGVVGPKPWPIVGNYGPCIWGNLSETEFLFKIYHEYPNEQCVGFFKGMTPVLLLREPLLIKYTLEKNIAIFFRRSEEFGGVTDEFLGVKDYKQWQINRKNISTLFSNSNLENIMSLLKKYVDKHQSNIDNTVEKEKEIEIKAKYINFYTESICAMCLGVSFKELPDGSEIEKMSRKIIEPIFSFSKLSTITKIFPILAWPTKLLINIYMKKFKGMVEKVLMETKILNQSTNTFTGRLVYVKDKIMSASSSEDIIVRIDENFIVQNVISMLISIDTVVNNFSNAILELAYDQDAQEKAHREIMRVLKDNDGKLSAKAIFDMTYLTEIQEEAQRVNSKILSSFRKCNTDFEFTELSLTIDRKAEICVPNSAILTDPQHFPESQIFKPQRYSSENIRKMQQNGTDLTFGFGPRKCIARRFTKLMVLIGLIMFLKKYKLEPSPLTKHRLELYEEDYREPKELKIMKNIRKECWVKIQRR